VRAARTVLVRLREETRPAISASNPLFFGAGTAPGLVVPVTFPNALVDPEHPGLLPPLKLSVVLVGVKQLPAVDAEAAFPLPKANDAPGQFFYILGAAFIGKLSKDE